VVTFKPYLEILNLQYVCFVFLKRKIIIIIILQDLFFRDPFLNFSYKIDVYKIKILVNLIKQNNDGRK